MNFHIKIRAVAFFFCCLVFHVQGHEDDSPEHLIEHLRARSAKGESQATYLLASEYARGGILVKNEKKALELYHQAAEMGSSAAQWILAGKYSAGKDVEKDKVVAYKWALLSVKNGSEVAQKLIPNFEKGLSEEEKLKSQDLVAQSLRNLEKKNREKSDSHK